MLGRGGGGMGKRHVFFLWLLIVSSRMLKSMDLYSDLSTDLKSVTTVSVGWKMSPGEVTAEN